MTCFCFQFTILNQKEEKGMLENSLRFFQNVLTLHRDLSKRKVFCKKSWQNDTEKNGTLHQDAWGGQ